MTAFITGLCMMIFPPIMLVGIYVLLFKSISKESSSSEDGVSDVGIILIIAIIVAIILMYFGYGIMDKAVVELGWWN